jgi:dienelactone hydrolase
MNSKLFALVFIFFSLVVLVACAVQPSEKAQESGLATPHPPTPTLDLTLPTPTPEMLVEPRETLDPQKVIRPNILPSDVSIPSEQGQIPARLYPQEHPRAPLILLLTRAGDQAEAWNTFALTAQFKGLAALAFALPGEAASRNQPEAAQLEDMAAASLDWLASRPQGAPQQVILIGEGANANLALRLAGARPEVSAVVLFSPAWDDPNLAVDSALEKYGGRPLLVISTEDDQQAKALLDQQSGNDNVGVLLLPGSSAGGRPSPGAPEAAARVLEWLAQALQPAP